MRKVSLPTANSADKACPDCPAVRERKLLVLIGEGKSACQLHSQAIEARMPLPTAWSERYAFAIVRRGWVIRSRVDVRGNHTAVDLVGPGALVPLMSSGDGSLPSGFAATRALVCLCPHDAMDESKAPASLAFDLMRMSHEALERVERIADARGRETAAEKVSALLAVISEFRGGKSGPKGLPDGLQQRDIAALLQLRPETVCRVLKAIESEAKPAHSAADEDYV